MSDFDNLVMEGASEAAAEMDDPILIGNSRVNSVFDADRMVSEIEAYGDTERITARAVISKADIDKAPAHKSRIVRIKTGVTYYVEDVGEDAGHYELQLYRETKTGNG